MNQKQSEKTPSALSKQVLKHNAHSNTQLAHTKEAQSARAHAKNKLTTSELPRLHNTYSNGYAHTGQRAHRGSGRRRRRRHHHARLVGAVSVLRPLDQTQRTKAKRSTTRERKRVRAWRSRELPRARSLAAGKQRSGGSSHKQARERASGSTRRNSHDNSHNDLIMIDFS